MIVFCANEIAGTTGYHKSLVENANALSRDGYRVAIVTFMESPEARPRTPFWSIDPDIQTLSLRRLAPDGGRLLHKGYHVATTVRFGTTSFDFTFNQLAAVRRLNELLSPEDTVVFTSPMQAVPFHRALAGITRRPRTILQIHGDYRVHAGLWELMLEARDSIDRLRTISSGLRPLFVPPFADADVVFIPNASGETEHVVQHREHDGVVIALPASFQPRKNQLDAISALSMMKDRAARLVLWGAINEANPYLRSVRELIDSLGLSDRVRIAGFGTESDVYSTADIVLMTSTSEGFGRPLIEAAFNGLPTVTYDFDFGPRDALEDGESGYIVPIGDVAALAEKLDALVADPAKRARFGHRAREIYDERFATKAILARHRQMLGSSAGTAVDLVAAFAPSGGEPVAAADLLYRIQSSKGRAIHHVTVRTRERLRDVTIDDGTSVRVPKVTHGLRSARITFTSSKAEVVSYVMGEQTTDRHYLANTTEHRTLEVLPWLRRDHPLEDAAVVRVRIPAMRWHWWLPARPQRLAHDVAWKLRQIVGGNAGAR